MNPGHVRTPISVIVLALLAFGAVPSESSRPANSFTLPFELIDNRAFVKARLKGRGLYHFILDTGATGAISDRVARELGLKVKNAGEGPGV